MNEQDQAQNIDFTVDTKNLYREEIISDLKVASIRKLIPVKIDGSSDESRTILFFGHSQLSSPQGPVPLQAPIVANTFEEAIKIFPAAMKKSFDAMVERVQKYQEQKKQEKKTEE